jgi:hypothetical protein
VEVVRVTNVTVTELVDRMVTGLYQPGNYAHKDDLALTHAVVHGNDTAEFTVETTIPNTDRETFEVTVRRLS